ncbi:MAG: hypothetical protein FD138_2124 [Planctomycetota bacterium]|nr:MAG: hypothetical protein FD138_2124 [Planctomycetota bacterium]
MVTLRKFLVCIAAGWATLGMSHWALAHEHGENEAAENEAAENKTSNHERSEHNGSQNEATERRGASRSSSSRSTSGGALAQSGSVRRKIGSTSSSASRTIRLRDGGTERRVNLRTFVGGRGKAEYKVSGTRRSIEVELENTTLQPGQSLSVAVNGLSVGSMTVGLSGRRTKAKFKLDTQFGNVVPTIIAGSVMTITLGTATVASATF